MFLTVNKEIEITEYTNGSVAIDGGRMRPASRTYPPLRFYGADLAYAIARTTCSSHLSLPELWYDCVIALLQTRSIVVSAGVEFRLIEARLNRIRDFSRTSRIGELAQGISYLFAQNVLNYPNVIDFHSFMSDNGVDIPNNTSTPDFILQKHIFNKRIAVLESKGKETGSTTSVRSLLFGGLQQCKAGGDLVALHLAGLRFATSHKFVVCTEFSCDTDVPKSKLHFVDPEDEVKTDEFDDRIMKYHYASWFYLIGDFENVKRLTKNEKINFNYEFFEEQKHDGQIFLMIKGDYMRFLYQSVRKYLDQYTDSFLFFEAIAYNLGKRELKIGIAKVIIDHLSGNSILKTQPEFVCHREEGVNYYADGTILSIDKLKL